MFRLIFLNGKMKGRRIAVQQGSVMIGRDPACHIDLAYDDEVSRNHAVIEQRPDGIYVKDLAAMNRTELNGKQIAGEAKLKHGDKLEIGRTQFEFQDIEESNVGSARALNKLQVVTFAAIGLIVVVQLLFVFVLPLLQQDPLAAAEGGPDAAATSAPPVEATATSAVSGAAAEQQRDSTAFEQVVAEIQTSRTGVVSAATTAEHAQVTVEVQQLRQALADLQQQLAELNQQTTLLTNPAADTAAETTSATPAVAEAVVTTAKVARTEQAATPAKPEAVAPAATAAAPAQVAAPATDALLKKARELLGEATTLMAQGRDTEADAVLERIQVLAPEFTPSYVERARVYERRGMLGKAGEQWTTVMELSIGTPLYEQAAAERQRLARAELLQGMTGEKEEEATGGSQQKLARRIRIVGVEREKFDANQEFDEMRLVRINVKPRMSEGEIDTAEFVCTVIFYDRSIFKQTVRPTRAMAPKDALKVEGQWPAGEQRTLTAAYIVPKGFRDEEEKILSERRAYEGYRVLIYYKGVLQDEVALPKTLTALPAPPPPDKSGR